MGKFRKALVHGKSWEGLFQGKSGKALVWGKSGEALVLGKSKEGLVLAKCGESLLSGFSPGRFTLNTKCLILNILLDVLTQDADSACSHSCSEHIAISDRKSHS